MGLVYTIHYDNAFNQLHYLSNIYEKKINYKSNYTLQ